jgi:hypothetical protein
MQLKIKKTQDSIGAQVKICGESDMNILLNERVEMFDTSGGDDCGSDGC